MLTYLYDKNNMLILISVIEKQKYYRCHGFVDFSFVREKIMSNVSNDITYNSLQSSTVGLFSIIVPYTNN